MDVGYYLSFLRGLLAGRKVVLATPILASPAPLVQLLRSLGVDRPFVISAGAGSDDRPDPGQAEWFDLDVRASYYAEGVRAAESALADPPVSLLERLERYDPDRDALVIGTQFTAHAKIADRPVYAARRTEWAALEDKAVIDRFWEAAGIPRAPSLVVPADRTALLDAHARLDEGLGTAWAGDAREGFNTSAAYLRWVRGNGDAAEAVRFFEAHCDQVRVMPFLEGIPCSVHGMVFPEAVVAFRPVEMITLRRPQQNRLLYAGLGTYWDPPDTDRAEMRATARRVGAFLQQRIDYRGAFTLDGVLTRNGFLPTELNPRWGAGMNPQVADLGFPLWLLDKTVVAGESFDYRPGLLEGMVLECADASRGGGTMVWTAEEQALPGVEEHGVVEEDGCYRPAREAEPSAGFLQRGPTCIGNFLRFAPEPSCLPAGPSFAPRAVAALQFADRELGTSVGPLEPARPAR